MSKKIWENKWICNPRFAMLEPLSLLHRQLDESFLPPVHREDLKNNHTLFRKCVYIPKGCKKVTMDITADDYYKLYINGKYATQGPANSYAFCYNYQHLDLTGSVREGENTIAVHVYYQGLVNRAYNSGDYRQGMIAEIRADGKLLTDNCWKCAEAKEYGFSRTIAYETQFDELIDNRKKMTGWKNPGFDDSSWEMAAVRERDDHVLVLQETPNVQMEFCKPVQVKEIGRVPATETGAEAGEVMGMPRTVLLDFGQDLTGTFFMKASGHDGDVLTILYGEELDETGQVRYELRCNCLYKDQWILAEGENELEQFEYKCFRYVQLIIPDSVDVSGFGVYYRHYPFDESHCRFHAKEPLLNNIWRICKNAVKNCAQEAFLDCPHREKGQYLGDLTVTAHAFYYLTGDTLLFRKALKDFANSTTICRGMMAVAPGSFMQEIADFSLLFPYQLQLYYRFTGDREFLKEMLPVAEGIEEYFDRFQNSRGLLENVKTKWNLVDWPENLRDDYDFDLAQPVVGDGCHNVINALYIGMKKCLEDLKAELGISCEKQSGVLENAFIHVFYRPETGLFADAAQSSHSSLHANIFAAFYGIVPPGNKIVELVRKKGLCCGVFVSYFVLYALIRMGEKELAYELIVNRSEHSWYQMLKEGAQTAFEAWGKEQKWNTSLCHAWASAPIPVLMECFPELCEKKH